MHADRDALIAFYRATGGYAWVKEEGWCTDAPLSEWNRVSVSEEGRVVKLRLMRNNLRESIPKELRKLGALTELDLSNNQLYGSIPKEFGQLGALTELNLSHNRLEGLIPKELGQLGALTKLNLSHNDSTYSWGGLEGSIPKELGQLGALTELHLSHTRLRGSIPKELGQLGALTELNLSHNRLEGLIPKELGQLGALTKLNLSHNDSTYSWGGLEGSIPKELGQLGALTELHLSHTRLRGSIPKELGQLGALTELNLSHNRLEGLIPKELGQLGALTKLNLSHNDSSWGGLEGSIPKELGQLGALTELHLSHTRLRGSIPKELGQLGALTELNLSHNRLEGSIPKELGQLGALTKLNLSHNDSTYSWGGLEGSIPKELGQLGALMELHLSHTRLRGSIPKELGQLGALTELNLSHNRLEGSIPKELGQLGALTELDLSGNKLEGSIPKELGELGALTELNLSHNRLEGSIPKELGELGALTELDLSGNKLEGSIPKELGKLRTLTVLRLFYNQLQGSIPEELGQLGALSILLSNNKLQESVSSKLQEPGARSVRVLSNTKLPGSVPSKLQQPGARSEPVLYNNTLQGSVLSKLQQPCARSVPVPYNNTLQGSMALKLRQPGASWDPVLSNDQVQDLARSFEEAITLSGTTKSWRLKVVVVGAVRAGKTSLIRGMMEGEPSLCLENDRTKGVDVHMSKPIKTGRMAEELEMVFWDFAGHSDYYSTHQLFLSKGAMYLLVVDIKRFAEESLKSGGDLIFVWLDALLSRVPGCNLLVVATQIDKLDGYNLDILKENLKNVVKDHLERKKKEHRRTIPKQNIGSVIESVSLVFHGVVTVSGADGPSLLCLREKLDLLVMNNRELFPSVGSEFPVSWARASAALHARRMGLDPYREAWKVNPTGPRALPIYRWKRLNYLTWEEASAMWGDVVKTLRLEDETGDADDVLKAAIMLQVEQGMFLQSSGLLYLDPSWINKLLRAILDHDLRDPEKESFWVREMEQFCDQHVSANFYDLKGTHDTFCSTGTLTAGYLRFLWRDIITNGTNPSGELFEKMLNTMSQHGVIFESSDNQAGEITSNRKVEDNTSLFVPVLLAPKVVETDLRQCETQSEYQYREDLVFEILQSYVPRGLLGLLVADFQSDDNVRLDACWSRGVCFTMGGAVVLLHLDAVSEGNDIKAMIEANVFGQKQSGELFRAVRAVQRTIKSLLDVRFPGLRHSLKNGRPQAVEGKNAVLEGIESLRSHIDTHLSLIVRAVNMLDGKMEKVAEISRDCLTRLTRMQSKDFPFPSLVIVRSATTGIPKDKKRTLRRRMKAMVRRGKGTFSKEMRLCFLCPYDYSEVPCGRDGNGYKFDQTREWVKALGPVLQVTAVIVQVAVKAASGHTLPVSDFLNAMKEGLGEELADRALESAALSTFSADPHSLNPQDVAGKPFADLVGEAYEKLKTFMEEHNSTCRKDTKCIHFDTAMERVDDGKGGQVWVSKLNAHHYS